MNINTIPTPALIVDENIFNSNSQKMQDLLKGSTLKLRPHYKSHKCSEIARFQMENGAIGMTCAKLTEAQDLVDAGIENILIANQIVDSAKISAMAHLAKSCKLIVCVDNAENVNAIQKACELAGSTIYCLIEYEIGMNRCGVSEKEQVLALAKQIQGCFNLVFEGVQAYAGHISHVCDIADRKTQTAENTAKIRDLLKYLTDNGVKVNTLSGGSTGTSVIKVKDGLYNELQAGSYLMMDATYKDLDLPFKNSLFVLATVVSVNDRLTVVDAGVKSCGVDQGMPIPVGFTVSEVVASEEHFQLHNPSKKFNVGDKVLLVPGHCCSTVNLHEKIYFVKDEKVSKRVFVSARGGFI